MSAQTQTFVAHDLVAVSAALLVRSWFKKRKNPGCGESCGAVSPEIKKLQARLKR